MQGINHVATVVSAVVYFVFGALWYTLLAGPWLSGIGKTMEQVHLDAPGATPYLICFVALLVIVYTLAWLIRRCGITGAVAGAAFGGALALGFVAAQLAINCGFEGRPVSLWLVNGGYALAGMAISGGIVGGWKRKEKTTG